MVSSAPAPLINPPVSYAERVKKAHSPRSPNLVWNSPLDFPAVPTAFGVSSSASPSSNATSQLPKSLNPVEVVGGSQASASDFPELPIEMSSQNAVRDHSEQTNYVHPDPHNVPKATPTVNVWTARMKEQVVHTQVPQAQKQLRATAASSVGAPSVPLRSRPIVTGNPSHPLDVPNTAPLASSSRSSSSQTSSLNGSAFDHDPFVVRMPPHLSRHSSSKSIPLVNERDDAATSINSRMPPSIDLADNHGAEKFGRSEGHTDTPKSSNSADLSRKNSIDSPRHESGSRPSSAQMSRLNNRNILEMNTTGARSVSHSRGGSHAGSSSSSPGLQVRGRRLPEDEMNVAYDPRLEAPNTLYNPPRMNSRVSERNPYYHTTFPHHPADITSHHFRSPPMAPTIDVPLHPPRLSPLPPAVRHPYALPIQSYTSSIPGHTSPTYAGSRPPSGAGTPPYTVYSPYPAPYGYSQSHMPWDGYISPIHPYPGPGYSSPLQDEYNAPPPAHLSFFNPQLTSVAEPSPNAHVTPTLRSPEGSQDLSPLPATVARNMVFGSIGLSHDGVDQTLNGNAAADKEGVEKPVERVVDQFSGFAIGVAPGEPGPFRQGNRKHSNKSLSGPSATPVAESADNTNTINDTPQEGPRVADERAVHDVAVPGKKWEFGTITRRDNEDRRMGGSRSSSSECLPLPADPSQRPGRPPGQHLPDATTETQPTRGEQLVTPPIDTSRAGPSILNSEDGSATSDVWEVKDYGYGFGDVSGTDNATDVIRRAMEIREKQRRLEWEKEHTQKQLQMQQEQQSEAQEEHTWQEAPDEGEGWDQIRDFGRGRPRRGSWASSYGPHERGGYGGRRGRGFSGRYQGRYPGRGGHHYQQPSISLTPPPQFNPLPLPGVDYLSGYVPQMPSYTPPDYELYHPVPATIPVNGGPPIPMPQSALPFPLDPTRSYLLGQLEYYLSPQNMVQDFFLRQRMDDQGWIPISLIASFNRVKQLTTEVQLVRDVLNLSSLTEVKGEHVRMASEQWKQFILPTVLRSDVCRPVESEPTETREADQADTQVQDDEMEEEGDTYDEEDEEEDDIVFVIGKEAEGSWAPEQKQTVSENT